MPHRPGAAPWLSAAIISLVAGVASSWAVTQYRVGKIEQTLQDVAARVAEIYCATVPVEKRQGCR